MINNDVLYKIGSWLQGTCHGPDEAIEHFELECDSSDLQDRLLDINIELCSGCGWWFESGELMDEYGEQDGFCIDCRDDTGDKGEINNV
jgi:hypothetical protein